MQKEVFEKFFERYLQNTLSKQELEEFMQVIKDGEHDDFIKDKIDTSIREDEILEEIDPQKANLILNQILSKPNKLSPKVISSKNKKKRTAVHLLLAAASLAIIFAVANIFFKPNFTLDKKQNTTVENPILSFSGKQFIHLPDGSTILLNENSSIQYNQLIFNNTTREVTLKGEAYFDIKRDETKPFIVHTGKVETKVLGTAFNINAYSNLNKIEVTVTRGKVQVGDQEKIYGVITPNQQIKINKNTLVYEQITIDSTIAVGWKSKYLIFDNINIEEAIAQISAKYKVPIILLNEKIKKCKITATFLNEEDLDHVLKVVCSTIDAEYHPNKNGVIVLEGKGCE